MAGGDGAAAGDAPNAATAVVTASHARPVGCWAASAPAAASAATPAAAPGEADEEGLSLEAWVASRYLSPANHARAAAAFAASGSLQLPGFLRPEAFAAVRVALGAQAWAHVGPPIAQSLRLALESGGAAVGGCAGCAAAGGGSAVPPPAAAAAPLGLTPDPVARLFRVCLGAPFRALVARLTGMGAGGGAAAPAPDEDASNACGGTLGRVAGAVRAFAHGDYTLVVDPEYLAAAKAAKHARVLGGGGGSDSCNAGDEKRLSAAAPGECGTGAGDALAAPAAAPAVAPAVASASRTLDVTLLCVGREAPWEDAWGGAAHYLTADEELLTLNPVANALTLVARAPGVFSFVEFVNADAPEVRYDVALQFEVTE